MNYVGLKNSEDCEYLMIKFLKVFENIMKKIRIHLLQKAFMFLAKNINIIKTGFQENEGIDFLRRF